MPARRPPADPVLHPVVLDYNRLLILWMRQHRAERLDFATLRRKLLATERQPSALRLPRFTRTLRLRRVEAWTLRFALARAFASTVGLVPREFDLDGLSTGILAPLEQLAALLPDSTLVRQGVLDRRRDEYRLAEGFGRWLIGADPLAPMAVEPEPALVTALRARGRRFRRLLREAGGTIHLQNARPEVAAALVAAAGRRGRTVRATLETLPLVAAQARWERAPTCAVLDEVEPYDFFDMLGGPATGPGVPLLPPVVAWQGAASRNLLGDDAATLDLGPLQDELRRAGLLGNARGRRSLDAAFYGRNVGSDVSPEAAPAETLADLVLDDETASRLRAAAEQARRGRCVVLLHGRPGTGKSFAARCLAGELDVPLRPVAREKVRSMWWGETERELARAFEAAAREGGVLLLDEADDWVGRRDDHRRPSNQQTATLLTLLERFTGVAVLTTNRSERIDPALFRRVDHVIPVPVPGLAERMALWARELGPDRALDPASLAVLAAVPLAGGDIVAVVREAGGPEAPVPRLVRLARHRADRRAVQG